MKGFLAVLLLLIFSLAIWAFEAWMIFGYSIPRFERENAPQGLLGGKNSTPQAGLSVMQGNSLFSMSYLPKSVETQVLGTLTEPNNYCDWDYLKQWWPEEDLSAATKVCYCESQGDPTRVNNSLYGVPEYSVSLFQINMSIHKGYDEEWLKVPANNIRVAMDIFYNHGGWKNWYNCAKATGVLP